MLVKDEVDVIEHTVRHLLSHDIAEVIVADNLSTDGTFDLLTALAGADERVIVRTDQEQAYYQSEKTTRLAQEALERGHQWVIPCDADELWYAPEGRSLRDWLDATGLENQMVKAAIYNHVVSALDDPASCDHGFAVGDEACPTCGDPVENRCDPNPFTRIRYRKRVPLDRQWGKVACRLRPDLVIAQGNHGASTRGTGRTGDGLEIRHFPYRSADHFVRKAINGYAAYRASKLPEGIGAHWRAYGQAVEEGGEEAGRAWFYDAFFSTDPERDDSLVYDPAPIGGLV